MPDTPELPPTVELWRPVAGWEDKYEVSSLGRVRDGKRLLGQFQNGQGYMLVRLSGPRRTVRVHRLVAEAFIANRASKPFVNHIDCDRANNAATNLEWCTQAENIRHSESLGRMQRNYWTGKRSPNAALSDAQAREIRSIYSQGGCSLERIGRLFEISKRAVGRIVNMETYTNA